MTENMRRQFANRAELITYLREEFPKATADADSIPATRGGRTAAGQALAAADPRPYESNRNYLNGAVTL